ncbi:MAG TPA: phosphoribosylanthranilate isomerase [Syntrophales bacterium]|nr:phosphoribosylanthranilate isomerase [Syntrophales bacterium]
MVQIKICGITNIEDGLAAASAGADVLGFVFHPASPRHVTPERAREIIGTLPPALCTVGVFVNVPAVEVLQTAEFCGLDFIQLHGSETREYCRRFPRERLIKALSFRSEEEFSSIADYPVKAFLVDAHDPVRFGGTGKTCDWNLARKVAALHPLILAGGLGEGNILAALETVHPLAVDISSGVEVHPGKKDHEKIRAVVAAVRHFERNGPGNTNKRIFKKSR